MQYPENQVKSLEDLKAMPLHSPNLKLPTYLNQVADISPTLTPTEVDHYQLQRTIDVYVSPSGEDLGRPFKEVSKIMRATQIPSNIRINLRGTREHDEFFFPKFWIWAERLRFYWFISRS